MRISNNNSPFSLMAGRLGTYQKSADQKITPIEGVNTQSNVLDFMGGYSQQERMILSKRRSFDKALKSAYQAAKICKVDDPENKVIEALINPNQVKQDYDDKVISVGFEHNIKPGEVFTWLGTNTQWIVYLQDLTELAYFRGDIRKCSYQITWEDEDGFHTTYAAVRGPVETKINYVQKNGVSFDTPNLSLNLMLPLNDVTLRYFQRYSKFYLQGMHPSAKKICWRVEALNWISTPGILDLTAIEYYANYDEDDVENGVVGALKVQPWDLKEQDPDQAIIGETFIKPKVTYTYKFDGGLHDGWSYDKSLPIEAEVFDDDDGHCCIKLKWTSAYSGQFDLSFGTYIKTIVVQSVF